ncbi:MDR family MFS transporter [Streptomyces hygroscopicus]|uniref:MDR family MFS transporter n=1 Tax=Streptomyces hygroscopicus TaxID=1912 RepID=UPI00083793CF|nr:MFS transporter [Streptomyces hygroscopicus]GLV72776.1 MFS transporter [Streptomyces hygroscopicus subsp. hygroscopicus]
MAIANVKEYVRESTGGLPAGFWWLWTSTLVNRLGSFVATFMTLYLTADRGYSASYAGLVVSLYSAGGIIVSPMAGIAADRLGRRPVLLVAQVSTAVSVVILGLVRDPFSIAVMAFLFGVASNASRPATQAMVADVVPPEDRVRAFSLNYWAINLGFAVSAVAAGFVVEYNYFAGFAAEGVLALACGLIVYVKIPESRPVEETDGSSPKDATPVFRDGRFMGIVVLAFALALVFQQGFVGLPLAMGEKGLGGAEYGMAIAVNGILIVAVQVPVTRMIQHRAVRPLLVFSSLLAGAGFGLTALAGSTPAFALTVALWTLAEVINAPTQNGLVVSLAPVRSRGRYQGVYNSAWAAAGLVAPLAAGFVLDNLGAAALWGGCAVLGGVAAFGYRLLLTGAPDPAPSSESRPPAEDHATP